MNAILALLLRLLLIILSYLFVGWIGYTIFMDLRGTDRKMKAISFPHLVLRTEIDQEIIKKQYSIPEIIIGRDPACDFPLENSTISLRHCKLFFLNKQWWAEDLGSTNGSYLNETSINTPIVLTDGDMLRLGRVPISIKFN